MQWQGEEDGMRRRTMRVLSARSNFRNLPFVPFIPTRVLLEEPRVRRGCVHCTSSILYASPTHRHPPQNQPRPPYTCTLCSVWTLSSWPSSSFNSCFVYTLVRFRTPSYIGVAPEGLTVDEERKWDGDAERTRRKEERKKRARKARSQGRRGHCSMHSERLGGILRKVDSRSESLFAPR